MATQIFVYGTLREGQPNYRRFLGHEGAQLVVRDVYTWPEFGLVSIADRYPGMYLPDEKLPETAAIMGDIYTVDSPTLMALDRLEGVPMHYQRKRIRLANGMEAQAYIINPQRIPDGAPVIASGDWVRYIRERDKPAA
jgi:gamma-glutamylcyclotransferase (GGCT)/AIG2-like uncharacterized protein YtfP